MVHFLMISLIVVVMFFFELLSAGNQGAAQFRSWGEDETNEGGPLLLNGKVDDEEEEDVWSPGVRSLTRSSSYHVLSVLYTTTNGTSWTLKNNWMNGLDPCASTNTWYGLTCGGVNSSVVTEMNLGSNNLQGSFPSQIGLLTGMSFYFNMYFNRLSGSLPSQIGQMTKISSVFDLHSNMFTGSLPSQIGKLTALTYYFEINGNDLNGSIPSQIGQLTKLTSFFLISGNSFSGSLPSQIGQMSKMSSIFDLHSNMFTGSLPSQIGQLSKLTNYFEIYGNGFSGLIPSQIGQLTKITSNFDLYYNSFCGSIPSEVAVLSSQVISNYDIIPGNSFGTLCCESLPLVFTCAPNTAPTSLPTLTPFPTSQPSGTSAPTNQPSEIPTPLPTSTPTIYCGQGTYFDGLSCVDCAAGYYSNIDAAPFATTCHQCSAGQYNIAAGSSSCTDCAAGMLSSADRTFCSNCDAGQYNFNSSECVNCESGKYAPQPLTDSCLDCSNGSHTNNQTKATTCTACDAGKYARELSVECSICSKGKFSSSAARLCQECAAGTFAAESGSPICTACSAGNYSSSTGSTVCSACSVGKYQASTGQSQCSNCESGKKASKQGSSGCDNCGVAYDSPEGSDSCDIANNGYYLAYSTSGINSKPCPNHAQCNGGYQAPVPTDGYWVDRSNYKYAGTIYECTRDTCFQDKTQSNSTCWDINQFTNSLAISDNCDKSNLQCDKGAGGPLCGSCLDDFVLGSVSNTCERCGTIQAYIPLFVVLLLCLLILVYLKMGDHFGIVQWKPVQFLYSFEHGTVKVLWVTYQIISASSSSSGIEFPPPFSGLLGLLTIFSFDFFALRCFSRSGETAFYTSVLLWCIIPIMVCFFIISIGYLRLRNEAYQKQQNKVRAQHIWMILLLSYVLLPPVSTKQLQVFDCIKMSNHFYLRSDTSINCESETYGIFSGFILLFIGIYQLIPVVWMYLLYQKKEALNPNTSSYDTRLATYIRDNNDELNSLRFLFVDYKCNKWWFEVIDMYRRIIFFSIIPLISRNPATRASFGVLLAIMSVAYYREEQPYRVEFTNVIAHIAQLSILITYYGALTIETHSIANFGLEDQKLGVFLLLLNMIISALAFWLAYSSFHKAKAVNDLKELKAATCEDARSFSENKFNTTFEAILKHSVPSSHTLVFHYTSFHFAVNARKSGIPAQQRFNGVPFSLRHPYCATELDFAVFDVTKSKGDQQSEKQSDVRRKFPHEEMLVLSLPKQFLDPLPEYEQDEGLCMISAQLLRAMRSTSFTAVVDSRPWVNGFALLPPHCILRSFLIMDKSSNGSQKHLSLSKVIYGASQPQNARTSLTSSVSFGDARHSDPQSFSVHHRHRTSVETQNEKGMSPVQDLNYSRSQHSSGKQQDNPPQQLVMLNAIDVYIQTMSKLRQRAFEQNLTLLYHYTSINVAKLILQSGLRMSTQGQGDGGVYFSTQGPASYGLGTEDYEINIIKDCFGVERIDEYQGQGKLDVIIVYACETSVLHPAPGGRENAKMISKSTFADFSLQHDDGNFFLRPDCIFAAFHVDPSYLPIGSGDSVNDIKIERHREQQVIEKLQIAEIKHQESTRRVEKVISAIWSSLRVPIGNVNEDEDVVIGVDGGANNGGFNCNADSLITNDIEMANVGPSPMLNVLTFDDEETNATEKSMMTSGDIISTPNTTFL